MVVCIVGAVGETVIAAVMAPVFQAYEVPPVAVSVTEPPVQMVPSFAVIPEFSSTEMAAVGKSLTVIFIVSVLVQPLPSVTVSR